MTNASVSFKKWKAFMTSFRKQDMNCEREVAAYLDEHLYSDHTVFTQYRRTDSLSEQLKGSDIVLTTSDGVLNDAITDEKVAISRANTNLNTFSLELSFLDKNNRLEQGWFLDSHKQTTHYLFGWILNADIPFNPSTAKYAYHKITRDNIHQLQYAIVKRSDVMDFLKSKGWTSDKIRRQDDAIRKRGYIINPHTFIDEVSFAFSPQLQEQPINILLRKQTYMRLATHKGIIGS